MQAYVRNLHLHTPTEQVDFKANCAMVYFCVSYTLNGWEFIVDVKKQQNLLYSITR